MANIGSLIRETIHPFGRNTIVASTGVTFGLAVSTGVSTSATVETQRITLPNNSVIAELECGLVANFYLTVTTGSVRYSWLIKDAAQSSYDLLTASTVAAAVGTTPAIPASPSTTVATIIGYPVISTGTYFTGIGPFDISLQQGLEFTPTTDKVVGRTINTSYVSVAYRLIG